VTLLPTDRTTLPATGRVLDLARHGARPAIRTAEAALSYGELAERVRAVAERLGATRRLVLVEGRNTLDALVAYLGALTAGHVVLLTDPGRDHTELVERYDPDVLVTDRRWEERRHGTAHDLHPDLALLLSTSGSTGSPKLVRLSEANLVANATAIADSLALTPEDRAITSLPLHYCYGLSVVHSHLLIGATVVLTDHSVVDECFWRLARDAGATSLAGVPYTFELLERSGFPDRAPATLRYLTQAGGRMEPEQVRRWADLGRRTGFDLVVMYGQTEATARMAVLDPALTRSRPAAIGRPVVGGSFRIDESGELVYAGPNVMMGYAGRAADLARGPELVELHTGDLAREVDGLFEVVGRRDRTAKLFGLRLDLDRVERLAGHGCRVVVHDETLHAFLTRRRSADRVRSRIVETCGLPASAVRVTTLESMPLTGSGKPDRAALVEHARRLDRPATATGTVTPESLRDDVALVLGRPDATIDSSFTGLGGDSLSYVELATRLSQRLGDLPPDWHTRPLRELAEHARPRRTAKIDTSVVMRAAAIVAIVGTHANLLTIVGGAHLLLVIAGFNFARFQVAADGDRRRRVRHGLTSVAQIAVPAGLWIAGVILVRGFYHWPTAVFLNGLLGSDGWTVDWQFWFLEAIVWATLACVTLLAIPALDRLERRTPYLLPLGLTLVLLGYRFVAVGLTAGVTERYSTPVVAWLFTLGWTAARATSRTQRLVVAALGLAGIAGFFQDDEREILIIVGIAVLACVPSLPVPRPLVPPLTWLAGGSLFIYLTHWQLYPHLEDDHPFWATALSLLLGIVVWRVARPGLQALGRLLRS
jgi:acyl-CoA synthetase (AMP-forming)/AMP-acid ligase II